MNPRKEIMRENHSRRPIRCPHGIYYWYPFECSQCIQEGANVLPGGEIVRDLPSPGSPTRVIK